jgi:hypothetical protein
MAVSGHAVRLKRPETTASGAQRVHRDALADLPPLGSGLDPSIELTARQPIHRIRAREQPAARQHLALRPGKRHPARGRSNRVCDAMA